MPNSVGQAEGLVSPEWPPGLSLSTSFFRETLFLLANWVASQGLKEWRDVSTKPRPMGGSSGVQELLPAAAPARPWSLVMLAVLPLLLLGALVAILVNRGLGPLPVPGLPLDELTVERVFFGPDQTVALRLRNTGPEAVTVNTVIVNGAVWEFTQAPAGPIPRLRSAILTLPYPWVEGEPYAFELITANAVKFAHEVGAAVETPGVTPSTLGRLALLGVYVGVIPVYLGLVWYPFLRGLKHRWYHALLAFTAGLLVFLGVDAVKEGMELALAAPGALKVVPVFVAALLGAVLSLIGLSRWLQGDASRDTEQGRLGLAYLIAAGIGLHNLGEGLAIGSAYAVGEIAVGALLVIGFTIHNTTEGPAIVAPVAHDRVSLTQLLWLGLLGGGPTVLGAWIGGYAFSSLLATAFFGIGAGAIIQVLAELYRLLSGQRPGELVSGLNLAGFIAGIAVMYLTGLAVTG